MVRSSVDLSTSSGTFATFSLLKTEDGPILRLSYTDGKSFDFALKEGWQVVKIGRGRATTVYEVILSNSDVRIKRYKGTIRFTK
jgi:hypothetical protein